MSDIKGKRKLSLAAQEATKTLDGAENHRNFSCWGRRESQKIVSRGLGSHQILLIGHMGRRGALGDKGQVEVVDDAVDHGLVGEKSDDGHLSAATRAEHRANLINLKDHPGPALGGDGLELLLHHLERESLMDRLLDLSLAYRP
jgi:hypothetical protein